MEIKIPGVRKLRERSERGNPLSAATKRPHLTIIMNNLPFGPKPIRTDFGGFLELICRFEFQFRRCGFFFERFEFLVCSKFNQTQCGRTCACVVACLCPHNSISNVAVSLTIHDNFKRYERDVAKHMKLLRKVINIYMCAYT